MSSGPIEFMGEEEAHEVLPTEMGGADGLIQPENDVILRGDPEASGGHKLDTGKRQALSDAHSILVRAAGVPLDTTREGAGATGVWTGEVNPVDPVTGREVTDDVNKLSGGIGAKGELSDLKP